jgi:hypothetical protein
MREASSIIANWRCCLVAIVVASRLPSEEHFSILLMPEPPVRD